jgi:cell division protein FtsB
MARRRFTITDLRECIEEINGWLEDAGADVRFFCNGRNGYQAVDEYQVDENGRSSSCNRMVGSGSSRETYDEAYQAYQNVMAGIRHKKEQATKQENKDLKAQIADMASENAREALAG